MFKKSPNTNPRSPFSITTLRNSVFRIVGLTASIGTLVGCTESGEEVVLVDEVGFTAKNELFCNGELVTSEHVTASLFIPDPKEADNTTPKGSKNSLQEPKTNENTYDFSIADGRTEYIGTNVPIFIFRNAVELPADYFSRDNSEFIVDYPVKVYGETINCASTKTLGAIDLGFEWHSVLSREPDKVSFTIALSDNPLCAAHCVVDQPGDGDTETGDGDGDTETGDGDGDTETGDGDGDTTETGDGDGDGETAGDGDGDGFCELDTDCDGPNQVCEGKGECVYGDLRFTYTLIEQPDDPFEIPWALDWTTSVTLIKALNDLTPEIKLWRDKQLVTLASAANGEGKGVVFTATGDCIGKVLIKKGSPLLDGPAQFDQIQLDPSMSLGTIGHCIVNIGVTLETNGKTIEYDERDVLVTASTAN